MSKKIMQTLMFVLSIALNVFGIMSLLHVSGAINIGFLSFYNDSMRLIVRYVIIVAAMAVGIMVFNVFAGTFRNKLKKGLSIGCCVYSTVLTVPLLLTFVGCFFTVNGVKLPMVGEIAVELQDIFKNTTVQYVIFAAGVLMSIIFLVVPIIMCRMTVRGKKRAKRAY